MNNIVSYERLRVLNLTTLAERRIRGDLIETFKIMNNIVPYCRGIFDVGQSGVNIISKTSSHSDSAIRKCRNSYFSNRVHEYWNKLPNYCKSSCSVDAFKSNLDRFKRFNSNIIDTGNFWEVSHLLLEKLEGPSYLKNKLVQNDYLLSNPDVAKRKGVNIYVK